VELPRVAAATGSHPAPVGLAPAGPATDQEGKPETMSNDHAHPEENGPAWPANGFVVRDSEGAVKLINGGFEKMTVKVTTEMTDGALSLMDAEVAPGFGNKPHAHTAEDEAFYVLSGEFTFINGDQTVDAKAGDFLYVPRGTRHGFKNVSDTPARMLVFYTPAGAEQFFLKYGEDPDPSGEPPAPWSEERFAQLAEALTAHNMVLLPGDDDWK
jgi:quercetin dioxygenase-like cupin family protein